MSERSQAESVAFRAQLALNSPRRTLRRVSNLPRIAPENRLVKSTPSSGESPLAAEPRETSPSGEHEPASAHVSPATPGTRPRLEKSELEGLIAREYAGLRLLISRRAGNPEVGADLLNDALCITWEKWQSGQVDRPDCIAGYIFQVAMNLLRNHRRSAVERPEKRAATSELDTLQHDAAGDRQMEDKLASRVRDALRGMGGARDREVLLRFYLRDEDSESICRALNLTPPQLARVLHRARGRLRKLLEADGMKKSDLFSVLLVM
jgi:RNA polymerase sigma-70 factor, ECF subfamily